MTRIERRGLAILERVLGQRGANRLASLYRDRLLPAGEALTYRLDRRGRRSMKRLREMAGRYAGERCFIIGNGPSLARTDLSRLRGERTFALNRGYLLFDRIGEPTTFLVAVNRLVIEQFAAELFGAGPPAFVSWRSRRLVPASADAVFVRRAPSLTFSGDLVEGAWEGATVTYLAMQVAFHLGFREVVLIGVDHRFTTVGPPNEQVTSRGADPDHFDPNYFGRGVRWELPDLEMSERAYRLARERFEGDGRAIVDATVGGNLTVFPKVDFESITAPGEGVASRPAGLLR